MTPEQRKDRFLAIFDMSTLKQRMIDGRAVKIVQNFPVLETVHVIPDGVKIGVLVDLMGDPETSLIIETLQNFTVRWSCCPGVRDTWPFLLVDMDDYSDKTIPGLIIDPPIYKRPGNTEAWQPNPVFLQPIVGSAVQAGFSQ